MAGSRPPKVPSRGRSLLCGLRVARPAHHNFRQTLLYLVDNSAVWMVGGKPRVYIRAAQYVGLLICWPVHSAR